MRQAGRSLPEYRALREKHPFFELAMQPELCAEVTLQPVRRHDVDAAVMFADIMTPVVAMGVDVELVEGVAAKTMMYREPGLWHALMERLAEVFAAYVQAKVRAGADAVQLFDSWVGVLSPSDYEEHVAPYSARILAALDVPTIHFGTGTAGLLERMAAAGGDVIGVDWRIELDRAWAEIGDRGIQGNLDPALLLGPSERVEAGTRDVLRRAAGRPGHVFNLGHGVLPDSPVEHLQRLVEFVHGV